ncbi:hypothetical protein RhiJN_16276 [Ceratobasidium sp. AG-Ba]|nr:hypothetical protein RhiJN_16276 [Ceratobasidium sp. AG-Ba]
MTYTFMMKWIVGVSFVCIFAATSVHAQGLSNLTQVCQTAVNKTRIFPATYCLDVGDAEIVLRTPKNESIVENLYYWLEMACVSQACAVDQAVNVVSELAHGCQTEFNLTDATVSNIIELFQTRYGIAREVACLKEVDPETPWFGSSCPTQILSDLEESLGQPLSYNLLISEGISSLFTRFLRLPSNITCTSCTQATYLTIRPSLNKNESQQWDRILANKCGHNFSYGAFPSNVNHTAGQIPPGLSPNSAVNLAAGLCAALLGALGVVLLGL